MINVNRDTVEDKLNVLFEINNFRDYLNNIIILMMKWNIWHYLRLFLLNSAMKDLLNVEIKC
jgi:hypothetical protein